MSQYGALPIADADITQKITVTTAGTPVQGPDINSDNGWLLYCKTSNTGPAWWMYTDRLPPTKAFQLLSALAGSGARSRI